MNELNVDSQPTHAPTTRAGRPMAPDTLQDELKDPLGTDTLHSKHAAQMAKGTGGGGSGPESPPGGLPAPIRGPMEDVIGHSFAGVTVGESRTANELDAQAYTRGKDVRFAPGKLDTTSSEGLKTLGHELVHVKQQAQGRVEPTVQRKGVGVNDSSGLEHEADELGAKAAAAVTHPVPMGSGSTSSGLGGGSVQLKPRLRRQNAMVEEQLEPLAREARLSYLDIPETAKKSLMKTRDVNVKTSTGGTETKTVVGEGEGGSIVEGTPRTIVEVADMEGSDIAQYPDHPGGPQARPILLEAFGSNWFFAKDVLVQKKWPKVVPKTAPMRKDPSLGEKLMWKLIALRQYEYDGILHNLRERYKSEDSKLKPDEAVLAWGSEGSDSLTSDVDVNLKGKYNMKAVGDFNAEFHKRGWHYEPGVVYDVNVYCLDNMHGFGFEKLTDQEEPLHEGRTDKTAVMSIATENNLPKDIATEKKDIENQEIAAMVKLIRFMTHGRPIAGNARWEQYKKSLKLDDKAAFKDKIELVMKVRKAEQRYEAWRSELEALALHIYVTGDAGVDQLKDIAEDHKDKHWAAIEMQASNRLYEQKIAQLQKLRDELAVLATDPIENAQLIRTTSITLRQLILEAGMFANEAMITAGASNFVVFGTQVGSKDKTLIKARDTVPGADKMTMKLTEAQFYHAFTEQFADTIKEFGHFDTLDAGLLKGGKYLMRMTLAADVLDGVEPFVVPHYQQLRTLGDYAMTAKERIQGDTDEKHKVMAQAITAQFPDIVDMKNVNDFLDKVMEFGCAVTAAYQSTKAGITIPPEPEQNDPEVESKRQARKDAIARKTGSRLRLADVKGRDLSEQIIQMNDKLQIKG